MSLFLLQMVGRSGVGKTTLSSAIGAATGAVVLDHDAIKSSLLEAGLEWDMAGRAAYEVDFTLAASCLAQGRSVIVDSMCRFEFIVQRGMAAAHAARARYTFIECMLGDEAEIWRRMAERTFARSQ